MRACSCRPCHSLIMERGEAELILLREAATILAVALTKECHQNWSMQLETSKGLGHDTKNLEAGKLASYHAWWLSLSLIKSIMTN